MQRDEHTFSVSQWMRKDAPRPLEIGRPRQVGCWSKQSRSLGGTYLYGDQSGLLKYHPPRLPANLNEGFPDSYIHKLEDEEGTPVEHIIQAAIHAGVDCTQAQVVTFRNNLNKITLTPLSVKPDDGWVVDACCHNGTMFLDIVKTPQRSYEGADQYTYFGYKFEALCTATAMVDSTSEFAALLRVRLGQHYVLMAAEMDCYDGSTAPPCSTPQHMQKDAPHYLELKTFKIPASPYQHKRLVADKYPRWWVQSFLAGVPTLVLGGRNASGNLVEVTHAEVASLPSQSKAAGQPFDAQQLLRFAEDLLMWMSQRAATAPNQHLRFEYDPAERLVRCMQLKDGPLPGRVADTLALRQMASSPEAVGEHEET